MDPWERRRRLLAWLKDPNGPTIPEHPAIEWSSAIWDAAGIVKHSGIYLESQRPMCTRDLMALRAMGELVHLSRTPSAMWILNREGSLL